jgi:hypothetical protein
MAAMGMLQEEVECIRSVYGCQRVAPNFYFVMITCMVASKIVLMVAIFVFGPFVCLNSG